MHRRSVMKGAGATTLAATMGLPAMSQTKSGLHVPAEEEPHELTFMQWPSDRKVHSDPVFLDILQQTIADIANAISDFEPVVILASKPNHRKIRQSVSASVEIWNVPTEDLWCRDSGPLFAFDPNGKRVVSHIQFNGWGGRQVHRHDGKVAELVAKQLDLPVISAELKGEPGGVDHDGHGALIAHESSWVNDNRNPGLSRDEIENRLLSAYGADRMIWAPGVWGEDVTDYHIDALARFTGKDKILINLPDNPDMADPFHRAGFETHDILVEAGFEVDVIPEPVKRRVRAIDFVASYANYYVCNGAVIAAQFGDKETDREAVSALRRHYGGREVVTLNVDALGEIGGGIHCATQQMPAA